MTALIRRLFEILLGRHSDWRPDRAGTCMRRWHGGKWETRPFKPADTGPDDLEWWNAIR